MNFKKRLWQLLFCISIFFNVFAIVTTINEPDYKLGILKQDIAIAEYRDDRKVLFKLPKGMTVVNVSPRGIAEIGLVHPQRFSFTVAQFSSEFIDYSNSSEKSPHGGLYQLASKADQP
jgi:hypothetical protein